MNQPGESAPPPEWQARLDTHLTVAMQALRECARMGEEFQPVAVFVKPDGTEDLAMLVFAPEAREKAIAGVTHRAREGGCRGFILVGDTWKAPPVPGRQPKPGDASRHPDREECLMLLLCTPNGSWARTIPYRREGQEIIFQSPDAWFTPNSAWNPWGNAN